MAAVGAVSIFSNAAGYYNGMRRVGSRTSTAMAKVVYRAAQKGRYTDISKDGLADDGVAESLLGAEKKYGVIKSWKVLQSRTTPIAFPIQVDVEVRRNTITNEVLFMHSP